MANTDNGHETQDPTLGATLWDLFYANALQRYDPPAAAMIADQALSIRRSRGYDEYGEPTVKDAGIVGYGAAPPVASQRAPQHVRNANRLPPGAVRVKQTLPDGTVQEHIQDARGNRIG